MHRSTLVGKVEESLRRCGYDSSGIVVAVSGGPDSVALLRALVELQPAVGRLVIAHLNHQLRGPESEADEAFVREVHASLAAGGTANLDFRCRRIDIAALAQRAGENLEKTARTLRYRWLAESAGETGLRWLATGHTANDQAETVLHRLLRGTGLLGLRGIARRRRLSGSIEVIRPLLTTTRQEVLAYLAALQQIYREDTSNRDLHRTRNRIRHELLPELAQRYHPAIVPVLCRLAEQATSAYGLARCQAKTLLTQAEHPRAGSLLIFDRACLAAAPRAVVREAFRLAWARERWPMGRMGFKEWDRLAGLALGENTAVDLPGGIQARRRQRVVQIGPKV